MIYRIFLLFSLLFNLLFADASKSKEVVSAGVSVGVSISVNNSIFNLKQDSKANRDWTIIVYMDGDNDLEDYTLKDINEMESALEDNIDIIVLVDRSKKYTKEEGDWSDSRVYKISKDNNLNKINSTLLQKVGELNMGDSKVLEDFLASAIKSYPAKHYALIMWDHGGGWSQNAIDEDAPNSLNRKDYLTLNELSQGVSRALKKIAKEKLDLIGFDMCLMSQIEVAYAIKDYFKVMVASEANEPGDGWPYATVLPQFSKGTQGVRGIATSIVDSYNRFYLKRGVSMYTVSALDLTILDSVVNAFNKITDKVAPYLDSKWSLISRSLFFSEAYQPRINDINRGKGAVASIDMMDALKSVVKNGKFKTLDRDYEEFVDIVDKFVLSCATSSSRKRSNGVSIYAPVIETNYNKAYESLAFAKNTNWSKFLNNLHAKQKHNATTPKIYDIQSVSFAGKKPTPLDTLIPMNTTGFSYKVDGKGILWIQGIYGLKSDKGGLVALRVGTVLNVGGTLLEKKKSKNIAYKLDMFIPDYKDGLNSGSLYFDGLNYLLLAEGKYRYATIVTPLDSNYIIVPAVYESKKYGKYNANIYFNNRSWEAIDVEIYIPQKNGGVVTRVIKPQADDKITLRLLNIDKDGKQSYVKGDSFLWKDGCELVLDRFDKGEYMLDLNVMSFNGISQGKLYNFNVGLNKVLENAINSIKKSPYKTEDFVGTWEKIDADKFMQGNKIVKLKEIAIYKKTKSKYLLDCFVGKRNSKNFDKAYKAYLDFRLFPHIRYAKLADNTQKSSNTDIDSFKVVFTMLYKFPNMYVMLQQDTLTYKFNVYIKKITTKNKTQNSTTNNQNIPQNTTPVSQQSSNQNIIDGAWQANDGERVYFNKGQYKIVQNSYIVSQGVYKIQGNNIYLRDTNTNNQMAFSFSINGNNLLMQSSNYQQFAYTRITQNASASSNSLAHDYAKLNGIWQMPGVATLVVQGNNYQTYEQGVLTDRGVFELRANNILISKSFTRGFTYQYRYKITDSTFDLIDAQGKVYRYFRGR